MLRFIYVLVFFFVFFSGHAGNNDINSLKQEFDLCLKQNRFSTEECEILFQTIVESNINATQLKNTYVAMISHALNAGDYHRAKELALDLQDKSLFINEYNNLQSVSNKYIGHAESRLGNHLKAVEHYKNALEYNRDTLNIHHTNITRLCLVANLVHEKRTVEAKSLFIQFQKQYETLVEKDVNNRNLHIDIGFMTVRSDILNAENRPVLALENLIKAESLLKKKDPILLHESIHNRLVYTNSRMGNYQEIAKINRNYKKRLLNHYKDKTDIIESNQIASSSSIIFISLVLTGSIGGLLLLYGVISKLYRKRRIKPETTIPDVKKRKIEISEESTSSQLTSEEKTIIYNSIILNIQNGQDWHSIYFDYCRLHPNICARLDSVFKGINGLNKIIICCVRLGLSNLVISNYLNLSTRSVESRKYRLIKRYGIKDQKSLKEMLMAL